jgi:hypothetical protein
MHGQLTYLQDFCPLLQATWQDLHSLTYICTCSVLMSSLPFTIHLEELQMRTFKRYLFSHNSSHNCTPKIYEVRYHCCFSQVYFMCHGNRQEPCLTRFAQPHVHVYMLCPYVISTLYHLLEELQMRIFKRNFSCLHNSSHNFAPKRNELRYHCCLDYHNCIL